MSFESYIQTYLKNNINTYFKISKTIYNHPELGMEEYKSSKVLCDHLEKEGFIVERAYVLDTAFKAVYHGCKKGYNIAFLCEYDALPEIGHGCGHNMIGAISLASACALKNIVDEVGGSIYVFGTPAEETHGGKVQMSKAHAFDEMDVAMMIHPSSDSSLGAKTLALNPVRYEFFGQSAHACEAEHAKSALDAAVLAYMNINMLRQFVKRDTYIHGVISEGGKAANVIPAYACLDYYFRAPSSAYTKELETKSEEIVKGVCLSTGCTYKKSMYECPYDDSVINYALCDILKEEYEKLNVEDILPVQEIPSGSSDIGSVSYSCPTLHGYIKICEPTICGHTIEFADATISEKGKDSLLKASIALAQIARRLLCEEGLMDTVKNEFAK